MSNDNLDKLRFLPCGMVFPTWRLLHSSVGTDRCLPSDLKIALSARMSARSFASFPRCAYILTKKVAVTATILFRSVSMAAARISASGASANVSSVAAATCWVCARVCERVCVRLCVCVWHCAGEAVQDVQKRTKGEREGGVENKNTHNTQISLNEQKLGEP